MAATFNDTTIEKEIRYNRANKDYDCFVAGQYVGSRSNYSDGETLCNEVAYDLISTGACYSATQLDGGSKPDEIAADLVDTLTPPIPTVPAETDDGSWSAPLGTLDGMPVNGQYHGRELVAASIVWQGMKVTTDGDEYINMPLQGGLCGDMSIANWQVIKALAQSDILERLIALARRYATAQGGWTCEGCGARLKPDDEDQLCERCHERRWQERFGTQRGAQAFRASFQQVAA